MKKILNSQYGVYNSPSKITFPFPFPPKTFSKQALIHNSQPSKIEIQTKPWTAIYVNSSNARHSQTHRSFLHCLQIQIPIFLFFKSRSLTLSLSLHFHGLLQALNSHYQRPLCPAFWRGPRHCGPHVCWQNHRPSPPDQVWGQQWEVYIYILDNWGFVILIEYLLCLMFEYSFIIIGFCQNSRFAWLECDFSWIVLVHGFLFI